MLFNALRIILWLIVSVVVVLIIRKTKVARKKLISILTIILSFIFISFSAMFPVENLFINFKSPESVFYYTNLGEIDDVIYGKESCMVIYSKGSNTYGNYMISKSGKGYKIPNYFARKKVADQLNSDGHFSVYNVLGTNDYYALGTTFSKENEINLIDSNGNKVKYTLMGNENKNTKTILFYSFIENDRNKYFILSNDGKRFYVS